MTAPVPSLPRGANWLSVPTAALFGAPPWLVALVIAAVLAHNVLIERLRCRRDVDVARASQVAGRLPGPPDAGSDEQDRHPV